MTVVFHGEKKINLLLQIAGSYKNLQAAIVLAKSIVFKSCGGLRTYRTLDGDLGI